MNYSLLFKKLQKEMFAPIQYRHLDNPYRAFAIVATIPFWILYVSIMLVKYVYLFSYNCVASMVDYLEKWVKEFKKGASPMAEAVIYIVPTVFIFWLRVALSAFSVIFYILWFLSMCFGYIASLGSIEWQPFIHSASFDESITAKVTTKKVAAHTIILIGFILFCLWLVLFIINLEVGDLYEVVNIVDYVYTLFMAISIPLTFKKSKEKTEYSQTRESSVDTTDTNTDFEEEFPDF